MLLPRTVLLELQQYKNIKVKCQFLFQNNDFMLVSSLCDSLRHADLIHFSCLFTETMKHTPKNLVLTYRDHTPRILQVNVFTCKLIYVR